jgi:hypothetical protein
MRLLPRFLAVLLAIGSVPTAIAAAGCLPGQTCWSQSTARDDAAQRQLNADRAQLLRDQQKLLSAQTRNTLPIGTPTPLEQIERQQDVEQAQQQLWQSQIKLQKSQQLLLDQQRPKVPSGQ